MNIIIITGLSGAGKSEALNFFEDNNYIAIDNLPCFLIKNLKLKNKETTRKLNKLALVIDVRSFDNIDEFKNIISYLKKLEISYTIIYIEANEKTILNRYNLTRRKHPCNSFPSLLESIKNENLTMKPIKRLASYIIDTSNMKPKELSFFLKKKFSDKIDKNLSITFSSFGFKYGVPIDLDLMFDVRFLPNPFYISGLKNKTGNDIEIESYVMSFKESQVFYDMLINMLDYLIPYYIKEGKNHLAVGIGCTGGKHRSVTFVNKLYKKYRENGDLHVSKSHRESEKNWIIRN